MKRTFLEVQPVCCILAVLALVILPIKWVIAWGLAVAFHELGHYLALKGFHIPVYSVTVKVSGAYMHTALMSAWQETVVAAMGPVFSLSLLFLARWIPYTACCAFFQLIFNTLPFPDFDGGRILGNCLRALLTERYINTVMQCIQCLLLAVIGVTVVRLQWGLMVFAVIAILFVRSGCVTFPCKRRKQIVQWCKRPKRGNYNERTAPKATAHRAEACPLHRR